MQKKSDNKKNLKYFSGEFGATSISYIAALITGILLDGILIDNSIKSGLNVLSKGSSYLISNLGIRYFLNKNEYKTNELNFSQDVLEYLKSNALGMGISYSLKFLLLYGLLEEGSIDEKIAPAFAYIIPGITGFIVKQLKMRDKGYFNLGLEEKIINSLCSLNLESRNNPLSCLEPNNHLTIRELQEK